ncbi:transglycosylase SLT domain-containing protein [Amphibacillus indicireducens]|uniref:Transglycosylase SLT domain-containing protein n=1 Tax=Amphibacillus indicireducens TaxID=1076330 RepID=A0ABP7VMZ2_9BACI
MKKTIIIFCLSILSATGVLFIQQNLQEKQTKMEALIAENRILVAENKHLKATTTYDVELINTGEDYKHWAYVEEIAEQMVKDSDERFKKTWAIYLVNEATQYEIDPFLIYELLKVETGHTFDPDLIGPETRYGHAYGMSQFMKNTAPWIADMADLPYSDELLFDPYYSMKLAIVYLDFLHHKYDDWDQALTAYNRGMTGMENYMKNNGTAKSQYAQTIQTKAKNHHTVAVAES